MAHTYPKLHNATWPGIVGKGEGSEPVIPLDTMIEQTAAAEVNGVKFDGLDVMLDQPHVDIDGGEDELKKLADKMRAKGLVIGSLVAPIWPPTGGSAFGSREERDKFLTSVRKTCEAARKLREMGIRSYGAIRIDTVGGTEEWFKDPKENQKKNIETFKEACKLAEDNGEKLAAEGEICWGGIHSWKTAIEVLEGVGKPETLGFQADMAHTLLFMLGYNAPEDSLVSENFNWEKDEFDAGYKKLTDKLRPWTIDFHVAQNDASVFGSGSHDKTGRHCQVGDGKGKLDIPYHAGFWMRDEKGNLTKKFTHICWDGCMFPNSVMESGNTWNAILGEMIKVRDQHGWD
jgi:sugar phosphate isomerase/epimerase